MTTLKTLADRLELSTATISRALNAHTSGLVSKATQKRVLALAAKVGYRPNPAARALVTGRAHTMGPLAFAMHPAFYSQVIQEFFCSRCPNRYSPSKTRPPPTQREQRKGRTMSTTPKKRTSTATDPAHEIRIPVSNPQNKTMRTVAMRTETQTSMAVMVAVLLALPAQAAVTGYWRFETDGGSGVTNGQALASVDDSSGNGRTGAPIGSPVATYAGTPFPDPVPQTGAANLFALNNSTDQGVLLSGAAASGLIGANFTIEAFIRLPSIAANPNGYSLFRSRDATSFPLGFGLVDSAGTGGLDDDLRLNLSDANITLQPDINLLAGVNYHVAATYDGATARLYVDGNLMDSAAGTGFLGTSVQSAIGNDPQYPSGYNTFFPGFIDEFRISNVALAPEQFLNATIPEPSAVMLLGLGGLLLRRRQRRSR